MPRPPKRWFPVSRDLNHDHEVWAFTDQYGERALRTWLEILAQLDQHQNEIEVTDAWYAGLSRIVRQQSFSIRRQVEGLLKVGWITILQPSLEHPRTILSARNYAPYHGTRVRARKSIVSPPNLTYPNRTELPSVGSPRKAPEGSPDLDIPDGHQGVPREDAGICSLCFRLAVEGERMCQTHRGLVRSEGQA